MQTREHHLTLASRDHHRFNSDRATKMAGATLCQVCQTIPLHDLTPFPDSSYTRSLSGYTHVHELIHRPSHNDPVPPSLGFPHHPSLEALRAASAAGCDLCREIEIQADDVLGDIDQRNETWPRLQKVPTPAGDPSFDLRVTARGEGGDGFWVVTKSESNPNILFPIAMYRILCRRW